MQYVLILANDGGQPLKLYWTNHSVAQRQRVWVTLPNEFYPEQLEPNKSG